MKTTGCVAGWETSCIWNRQRWRENWRRFLVMTMKGVVDPLLSFCIVQKYANFIWKLFEMAHSEIKKKAQEKEIDSHKKAIQFSIVFDVFSCEPRLYMHIFFFYWYSNACHVLLWMQRIVSKLSHDPFYFPHRQSDCVGIPMHDMIRLSNSDKRCTYFNIQGAEQKICMIGNCETK